MKDIIQLLPDQISNQIAAGEVIQRPSSAVKELIENAIDAQASKITLLLKDAGRTLIQVNDNGIGMSKTDARRCFEKHATSKIKTIDDLFKIQSNGFRGEALASIAAVSQVELKTQRASDEVGTFIHIENSKVISQEPISVPIGTQILMKNLFYNVPARRNFLKNDSVELRHCVSEFIRLALAYPTIDFSLYHNDKELYRIYPSSLLKRIVNIFGSTYNEKMIPIHEESDIIKIKGFVSKPSLASTKSKDKQYLYVNNRFIKSQYIQHAIYTAYKELLKPGEFPFFVIFIDIDPSMIDINVHPTKQEIKFEDESLVYGFVNATIRRSLMQYNIAPSLDFNIDPVFNNLKSVAQPIFSDSPKVVIDNSSSVKHSRPALNITRQNEKNWDELFRKSLEDEYYSAEISEVKPQEDPQELPIKFNSEIQLLGEATQVMNKYLVVPTNIGLLFIHQKRAHERILFDELQKMSLKQKIATQRLMFPICVEFSLIDSSVMEEILNDLNHLGFDISPMGNHIFAIQGIPSDLTTGGEKELLLELVENFKNDFKANQSKKDLLLTSICKISSINHKQELSREEIQYLVQELFERENFQTTPRGHSIFYKINYQEIEQHFKT